MGSPLAETIAVEEGTSQLAQEKQHLEILELRQRLRFEKIRLVATVGGILAFLGGFALNRYVVYEQRRWERMVEIAAEYEDMVRNTLRLVEVKTVDSVMLHLVLEDTLKEIRDLRSALQSAPADIRASIDDQLYGTEKLLSRELDALADPLVQIARWSEGSELESKWSSRSQQLSPDFQHFYGKELAQKWPALAAAAEDLLKEEFSLVGGEKLATKKEAFEQLAASFQEDLYRVLYGTQEPPNPGAQAES